MDFNLSSICDMLAERLEEYKSSSKKRRIKRGRTASKAKIAKLAHENQAKNTSLRNETRIYASTPRETPTTGSPQFSTLGMFSSISKLPTPGKNQYTEKRKLTFDEDNCTEVDEKSEMDDSPASFSSVTKTTMETLKRRRIQRKHVKVRKLFIDDDDSNDDECSSKDSTNRVEQEAEKCFINREEYKNDELSSKDSANYGEFVNDECLSRGSNSEIDLNNVLTPLCTPKKRRLSRKCLNVRRLTFDDDENEDSEDKRVGNRPTEAIEEKFSQIKSPLEKLKGSIKDQDLAESWPNDCFESTLITNSEEMVYSTMMVLNVGILIRPIRDVLQDK